MKVSMKTALKKIELSLFVASAALLWTTCDVGLGEAVDTLAPTVSVSSPAASTVCKGAIDIAGSCLDDKAVASVTVVIKNTETGATYNYNASVSNLTSWSLRVNDIVQGVGYPLADGSYTADVTATDIFGRTSGTSSTAFDIDNTPPLFCVTSPASLDISNPRNYGRSVTISGEIADDHDIDKMDIRVFRVEGGVSTEITSALAKTTFTDFETAGGTTVYIAKYFDVVPFATKDDGSENPDYKLYQNYMAIYGDPSKIGQDVLIYVVPTLTDIAGNVSDHCYLSTNIKTLAASLCGVELTADSLQTAQLMKIYNGTYSLSEFSAEQKDKVLSLLNGTYELQPGEAAYYSQYDDEDTAKQSPLAACVNSNNSPTYDFNGYQTPTTSSEGWVGINTGGTLTITLKAGRDGWGILPSSLEVNLYECNSATGAKTSGIVFSSNGEKDPSDAPTVTIKDATNTETCNIATTVTNQSYYITLPSLKAGNHYVLEAGGKDENDSELVPVADWYGFRVASSITPPTFSASDSYYANAGALSVGAGLKFRLNIKDESDKIKENGIEVTAYRYDVHIPKKAYIKSYDSSKPAGVKKTYFGEGTSGATGSAFIKATDSANHYYIDLPIKDFAFSATAGKNYSIVLETVGNYKDEHGGDAQSSPAQFLIWIDAAAPDIAIKSPDKNGAVVTEEFPSYESDQSGNSCITPNGIWSDKDGSATHRLWYTEDDAETPTLEWTKTSDSETFVSGTNYYEKQVAGNTDAQSCYALLDTDKFVDGQTPVKGYYKLSLEPSASGKTWTEIKDVSQAASETTWEQKIAVAQSEGKMFRVVGVDAVGNLSVVVERTGLKYDFSKPTIELKSEPAASTKISPAGYYNAADIASGKTLEFTVKDTYKISKDNVSVTAVLDGDTDNPIASGSKGYTCVIEQAKKKDENDILTTEDDPTTVNVTITLTSGGTSDGDWAFTVNATDAAGRPADSSYSVTVVENETQKEITNSFPLKRIVDTLAPTFEPFPDTDTYPDTIKGKTIAVGSGEKANWTYWEGAWYSSAGLVFHGNINESTSGLAKISYSLTPAGSTEVLTGEKSRSGEKGTAVEFDITATGFKQSVREKDDSGNLKPEPKGNALAFTATDKAGNVSGKQSLTINIDQTQPLFGASWYVYEGSSDYNKAEGTLVSDGTKAMTVYGTVSSDLSGVAGLDWTIKPAAGGAEQNPSPTLYYTTAALDATSPASAYTGATWKPLDEWYEWEDEGHTKKRPTPYKITGWKAVIEADKLTPGDVYAAALNIAKKSAKAQIFTIDRDIEAPSIVLNTPDTMIAAYKAINAGVPNTVPPTEKPDHSLIPTTVASVNGTQKISGSVSDNKELENVKVYWSLDATATIDESGATPRDHRIEDIGPSMYNWTVNEYQFSKISADGKKFIFNDGTEYSGNPQTIYIKVFAADKAQNQTISVYKYSVDPDSDRPKITMTVPDDLTARNDDNYVWKKNTSVIRGKVEDDDGLTGLKIWYNDNDEADSSSDDGKKWTELSLTSGVFEIFNDSAEEDYDKKHKLLFKIVDANGTEFITGPGAADDNTMWLRPKIVKQAAAPTVYWGSSTSDDTSVYIEIDTQKPKITNKSYSVEIPQTPGALPDIENASSSLGTVGGTRNKFNLFFYAYDQSGLDESKITFTINGNTYSEASSPAGSSLKVTPISDKQLEKFPTLKGYSLVTVSGIDVSDKTAYPSASYTGTIKVYDKAGTERSETVTIEVDNTPPTIASIEPSQSQAVSGDINAYGTVDGAKFNGLAYALTYIDKNHSQTQAETAPADSDYSPIKQKSALMWYLYFDNGMSTDDETHSKTLNDYIIEKGVTATCSSGEKTATAETIANHTFDAKVQLYLWIKAVDEVGNQTAPTYYKILLDPQGNTPEVSFTYPATNGETDGGEIKAYGGAKAKSKTHPTIQAVYAQIVSSQHKDAYSAAGTSWGTSGYDASSKTIDESKFKPSANDLDYLKAAGYKIYKMSDGTEATSGWTDTTAKDYGIKAVVSGSSWSVNLNSDAKKELDPDSGTNTVAIRVYSYDGANLSQPATKAFIVDADNPQLKNDYLKQFGSDGSSATATASKSYTEGMYVKGKWFLTFSLSDGQGMGKIQIGKGETAQAAASNLTKYLDWNGASYDVDVDGTVASLPVAGDYTQVDIKYPLDTDDGCGTQCVYVYYEDKTGKGGETVAKTYKISYDNKAPVLAPADDKKYDISATVQQTDGWYSFSSKVSEDTVSGTKQSGFERLAFYFTRGNYIFDPMIKRGADGNKFAKPAKFEDGLYWKVYSVTCDGTASATMNAGSDDKNIHVGGLAKIDGTIYKITAKTGATVTVAADKLAAKTVDALFAVANVVDNEVQENDAGARKTSDYGFGYGAPSNDDGDLMLESIINSGTDWIWNANIYSKNISDGPVQIHYVAFDKAQNWAQAGGANSEGAAKTPANNPPVVAATVSNNALRIANLYVGTDLNGDNKVGEADGDIYDATSGEWAAPYAATSLVWNQDRAKDDTGKDLRTAVKDATLGEAASAYLTAKGKTILRPEILGGNGNLYYQYAISNSAGTSLASGTNTSAFISGAQTIVAPLANEEARQGVITIQVGDFTSNGLRTGGIPDCAASAPHKFDFTFYDETEGATGAAPTGEAIFAGSNTAKATVYMAVNMTDAEEPKATREDLFWNGAGAADDEGNPKNSIAWNGDTPLGHIDLSADLPDIFKATGAAAYTKDGTTYPKESMDRDSKASGKIVLRGTVSDNKMLKNIYLNFTMPKQDNITDPMTVLGTGDGKAGLVKNATYGYPVASYNAASGNWDMPVGTETTLASYGIQFTVTKNKVSSAGHSADWEFVWDTSYVYKVAKNDVTVDVYSSDQIIASAVDDVSGTYVSLNGTTKYAAPAATENNFSAATENHPAQLKVDVVPYITSLETFLSKKGVDAARSAKGHWPVKTNEAFTVKGFNFKKGNADLTNKKQATSVYYSVKVNNVYSFNNINNNDAALSGSDYSNAYNRQPNGRNNDYLTDDVYIDSWTVKKAAQQGNQTIENPVMKINPNNGMIGFAFRYGPGQQGFAMPYGNINSYQSWHSGADTKASVTFAYDSAGNTYGTTADGDSAATYSDFFSFHSSFWGPSATGDKTANTGVLNGDYCARIEMTGQTGTKAGGNVKYYSLATKHQSPVIATARTNVYLAYYDSFNKEIRFRSNYGGEFKTKTEKRWVEVSKDNWQEIEFTIRDGNSGNFIDQFTDKNTITTYNYDNCQIVAEETSAAKPGEYVCMAAIPNGGSSDDAVVMVWYGGGKMWYSYNDTPNTDRKHSVSAQTGAAADGWSVPVNIFSGAIGKYCKVAVDGAGGVHIAAQDATAGAVWYAYLSKHNPNASGCVKNIVKVDTGNVGKCLTIDAALDSSNNPIPFISYYSSGKSLPKCARPVTAGDFSDGISGSKYTGTWEISYVPSDSKVKEDNINVGVWKNPTGVIATSTEGTSSNGNNGTCYGNGTANAVLGYKYTDATTNSKGYLETAQLTGDPTAAY